MKLHDWKAALAAKLGRIRADHAARREPTLESAVDEARADERDALDDDGVLPTAPPSVAHRIREALARVWPRQAERPEATEGDDPHAGGQQVSRAPAAGARVRGGLRILLHLDNNREVVCSVQRDGTVVREVESDTQGESFVVFSSADLRYKSKPVSHAVALAAALENQGQAVRLVNRSSDLGAYFTRPLDQMTDYEITPGGQLVDFLLGQKRQAAEYPRAVAFRLGTEASTSLAIFFYYDDAGEVGRPQISINPQSFEFALSQFATSRKFDAERVPLSVFDHTDLRRAAARADPYVDEDLYLGRSRLTWLRYGVAASATAVLVSAGAGGYYYLEVEAAESAAAAATTKATMLVEERRKLLLESSQALGAAFALDGSALLAAAESVWRPGFGVMIDTDKQGAVSLHVTAELARIASPEVKKETIAAITGLTPPSGCARDQLLIAGSLNHAKVTFKCAHQDRAPSPYRVR